jgi:MFS family permease
VTWIVPVAAMFSAQFGAAFPLRVLPVLAPIAIEKAALSPGAVGYLASCAAVGSMVASLATGRLVDRFGAVGALQLTMLVGTAAAAIQGVPFVWAFAIGSFLAGVCDGPTPVAGSAVLYQIAPGSARNLLFSIKMLGGPVGGLVAALTLPQMARSGVWWSGPCLAASVTALMYIFIRSTAAKWPSASTGSTRPALTVDVFVIPLYGLLSDRHARRLGVIGFLLAFAQGSWYAFYVLALVQELGRTLVGAGALLAIALGTGIVARLLIAGVTDILGRGESIFVMLYLCSALPCFLLAYSTPDVSDTALVVVSVLFGFTLRGWVGLQHAELARRTPQHLISSVSGAAVSLMFFGAAASGPVFAAVVDRTGGYRLGFAGLGVIALLVGIPLWLMPDQKRS